MAGRAGDPHEVLGERFQSALVLACELHSGQVRKGSKGIPYVGHLLGVASIVIEDGGDEDEAIAALLHDAPEDQGGEATLARIRSEYGERVGAIVEACTDTLENPKPPWRGRKERYIAHLEEAAEDVLRVSLAGKGQNGGGFPRDYRGEGGGVGPRFGGPPGGSLWLQRAPPRLFPPPPPRPARG